MLFCMVVSINACIFCLIIAVASLVAMHECSRFGCHGARLLYVLMERLGSFAMRRLQLMSSHVVLIVFAEDLSCRYFQEGTALGTVPQGCPA